MEKTRNTDVGSAGLAASHINNRVSGDKVTHPGTIVKPESLTPGEEGTVYAENGDPVAHSTEDGTIQLSMRTYDEEGREAFRKYLQKCVTSKKLTKAEMQEMLDSIEEIYGICKDNSIINQAIEGRGSSGGSSRGSSGRSSKGSSGESSRGSSRKGSEVESYEILGNKYIENPKNQRPSE